MSSLSTRFTRQLRSEMTVVRTDRVGHTILLLGLLVSGMWGMFMAYLTIIYQHTDADPNPRVPAAGLAQLGYFALMVWVVMAFLGPKTKGFWNMRALVEPRRTIMSLATLVQLTVWSAVFAVITTIFSTLFGIGIVKVMSQSPSPLVGSPSEIATVLVQMVGLTVGASWFAAGWALVCNNISIAVTAVVIWPFLIEGMLPSEGAAAATLRGFMPFVNGIAWYQSDDALQLYWPAPVGLIYFLVITLIFALIGVWMRRNETLSWNS